MGHFSEDDFVEHFLRTQSQVYGYIATLLPNRTDADEIFQQTSLVLWKRRDEYDPAQEFVCWACGIAHNLIRNFIRAHSNRSTAFLSEEILDKLAMVRFELSERINEQFHKLEGCLAKLPPEQYRLLEHCYLSNQPINSVAAECGLKPSALYKRLDRIRSLLLECLGF